MLELREGISYYETANSCLTSSTELTAGSISGWTAAFGCGDYGSNSFGKFNFGIDIIAGFSIFWTWTGA